MANSVEYRTMVKCTRLLTEGLSENILDIGAAFWERDMIPPGVNDILISRIREPKDKTRQLVSTLTSTVRICPEKFYEITNTLLDQGPHIQPLMTKVKNKYEEAGGTKFPDMNRPKKIPQTTAQTTSQNVQEKTSKTTKHICSSWYKDYLLWAFICVIFAVFLYCLKLYLDSRSATGCTPITNNNKLLVYKSLSSIGDWEKVCIALDANEKRNSLIHEQLTPDIKIVRCVDYYLQNKETKCFEYIVDQLCNFLQRRVAGIELADKTGVDHQTICGSSSLS